MPTIKISILGDQMVGKTLFFSKLEDKYSNELYNPTLGVCFHNCYINDDKIILYDITGDLKYDNLIKLYVKFSHAFIIIVDNRLSIDKWIDFIKFYHTNLYILVILNNIDINNTGIDLFIEKLNKINIMLISTNLYNCNSEKIEMLIDQFYKIIKNIKKI